jgi:hypothetical protein
MIQYSFILQNQSFEMEKQYANINFIEAHIEMSTTGEGDSLDVNDKGEYVLHSDTAACVSKVCEKQNIPYLYIGGIVPNKHPLEENMRKMTGLNSKDQDKMVQFLRDNTEKSKSTELPVKMTSWIREDDIHNIEQTWKLGTGLSLMISESLNQYPVQTASRFNAHRVLNFLLQVVKVDPLVVSFSGRNALHYACLGPSPECIQILASYPKLRTGKDNTGLIPLECGLQPYTDPTVLKAIEQTIMLPFKMKTISMIQMLKEDIENMTEPCKKIAYHFCPELLIKKRKDLEDESETCMVCLDRLANTMVLPCEHSVVCKQCSDLLKKDAINAHKCIKCRQDIKFLLE